LDAEAIARIHLVRFCILITLCVLSGRQPDIHVHVGGLIFYHGFFFFFSRSNLRDRWTELNQNRPRARKKVQFENACPQSGVCPLPYKSGAQKPLVSDDFAT